jgi:hypothetical protein
MAKGKKQQSSGGFSLKSQNKDLIMGKTNYIIIGFILMAGGGSDDPTVFDAESLYSTRRITVAPILVLVGLALQIVAIFKKPSPQEV